MTHIFTPKSRSIRALEQNRNNNTGIFERWSKPVPNTFITQAPSNSILKLINVKTQPDYADKDYLIFCKEGKSNYIAFHVVANCHIPVEARLVHANNNEIVIPKHSSRSIMTTESMDILSGESIWKIRIEEISRSHKQTGIHSGLFCIEFKPAGVETHEWLRSPLIKVISKPPLEQKKKPVVKSKTIKPVLKTSLTVIKPNKILHTISSTYEPLVAKKSRLSNLVPFIP